MSQAKIISTDKKPVYQCERCVRNTNLSQIDIEFWGCPRGSCDAVEIGEAVTTVEITFHS